MDPCDQRERRAGSKSGVGWPARDFLAHVIAGQGGRHPCTNHGCVVDRHCQSPTSMSSKAAPTVPYLHLILDKLDLEALRIRKVALSYTNSTASLRTDVSIP